MLKNVAMLLPTVELYVIIPTQSVNPIYGIVKVCDTELA